MDLGLNRQVAVVLGASRGLGAAVACELAREGARLALCARDAATLSATAERARALGATGMLAQTADITEPGALRDFVDATLREYGRIDVLVTNAGGPRPGRVVDLQSSDWEHAVQLLLMSAVHARWVVPVMRTQHGGSIVLIASMTIRQPIDG
jgi:3-oxoacyl-[acyl-carrier protein] reductase